MTLTDFRRDRLSLAAAADWLEERHGGTNAEIAAGWLRAGEMPPGGGGGGDGYGDGGGYGDGYGDGYGGGKKHPRRPREDYDMAIQVGDYVCVRSREQGVVWGVYGGNAGREVTLTDARQQHSWNSKALSVFALAAKGPAGSGLRLDHAVAEVLMLEACGVILVAPAVAELFRAWPVDSVST